MTKEVKDYIINQLQNFNIDINNVAFKNVNYIAVNSDGHVYGYQQKPRAAKYIWHSAISTFMNIRVPIPLVRNFKKEIISVEDFNKLLKQRRKDSNMIDTGKVTNGIITYPIFENNYDNTTKNNKDNNPYMLDKLESLRPIFIEKQQINPYFSRNFNEIYHTDNFYYKSRTARHQTENIIFSFEYNDIANDPKVITIPLSIQEYERWCNGLMLDSWLFDAHVIRQVFNLRKINNEYQYKNKGKKEEEEKEE